MTSGACRSGFCGLLRPPACWPSSYRPRSSVRSSSATHGTRSSARLRPRRAADPTARLTSLSGTRYAVWKSALKAFAAHPAGGTGAGTFEFWWDQHATNDEFLRDAHSIWLENMAELGVPGLVLIIGVMAAALAVALAVRRRTPSGVAGGAAAAFAAAFVVYLLHATVDWMWESTAVTVLAFAGVAVIGARISSARPRLRLPARATLAVAAAIAAILQLPGLLSTAEIRRSQAAERAGNPPSRLGTRTLRPRRNRGRRAH